MARHTAYRSAWVDDEVAALTDVAAKFFATEVLPHRERWEEQQHVDREVWQRAGRLGLLCCSVPEEYGGGGGTFAHDLAVVEAQARTGDMSFGNLVHSGIVAHYLLAYGTEEQKRRWLPRMAAGELIGAIAMTEPGAGSDLQGIRTTAYRDGDDYRINGTKTFISNGALAGLVLVVAKTDPAARSKGISLLAVEVDDAAGFSRGRNLEKIGQHGADTTELFFDDVRVPADSVLGGVAGRGFAQLMEQLVQERLVIAANGVAMMETAVEETLSHTRSREAFGQTLFDFQNTRFVLAEAATTTRVARAFLDACIVQHLAGSLDVTTAAMVKWWVTDQQFAVIDRCLQLFGGYGYMREYPIARMFTDARIQRIYGGANEVMKDLVARGL